MGYLLRFHEPPHLFVIYFLKVGFGGAFASLNPWGLDIYYWAFSNLCRLSYKTGGHLDETIDVSKDSCNKDN